MRTDFLISVLLEDESLIKQMEEERKVKNIIQKALYENGYKFIISESEYINK